MISQDGNDDDDQGDGVGYRQPPATTRYRKGQSGNQAGRPRGRRREAPYEAVLGQTVSIREAGVTRRVPASDAFLLYLRKLGLEGNVAASRATLAAIEQVTEEAETHFIPVITRTIIGRGSITPALVQLRMATKLDPYRKTARMALEPWLVEAGLARLKQTLSSSDQQTIVKATRNRKSVKWPGWWSENP